MSYIRTDKHRKRMSVIKKGCKHTSATKKKISDVVKKYYETHLSPNKGRVVSKETREKLSKSLVGKFVGKDNSFYGKRHTEESRKKISEANKGKLKGRPSLRRGMKASEETKEKLSKALRGRKFTEEHKRKISNALKGRKRPEITGDKNPHWKGGISPVHIRIRQSEKYIQWRKEVFSRDNYSCQECGQIGGRLEVHHLTEFCKLLDKAIKEANIMSWPKDSIYDIAMVYEPLWDTDLGKTLCKKCHDKKGLHKWAKAS